MEEEEEGRRECKKGERRGEKLIELCTGHPSLLLLTFLLEEIIVFWANRVGRGVCEGPAEEDAGETKAAPTLRIQTVWKGGGKELSIFPPLPFSWCCCRL